MSLVTIRVCVTAFQNAQKLTRTIQNVEFLNNPAKFSDSYRFRVTFECIAQLEDGE